MIDDIIIRDNHDDIIYWKDKNDYESWFTYDNKHNIIHVKQSDNFECWYKYDKYDDIVYERNADGLEFCFNNKEHSYIFPDEFKNRHIK